MKKKFLPILVVLFALLMLGCGTQEKSDSSTKTTQPAKSSTSETKKEEEKVSLTIGSTVSLSDIQKYIKDKPVYEVYAIKKNDKDEFTVISTLEAELACVDIPVDNDYIRLYPSDREFMLNLDDSELVVFTTEEPISVFTPAYDLTYFAPIVLSKDLSQICLPNKDGVFAKQLLSESVINSSSDISKEESVDVTGLTLNGIAIPDIKAMETTDETDFGYVALESSIIPDGCAVIHTGFNKELTLEGSIGSDSFNASLKPAVGFLGYGLEGDEPAFTYTENADGYYVYDFTSDEYVASELVKKCGLIDEEDWYSRLMINDQSVLGFISGKPSNSMAENVGNEAAVTVEIAWDEADVTFYDDPRVALPGVDDVVPPTIVVEGATLDRFAPIVEGTRRIEILSIYDTESFLRITVEPDAPTNNCPLNTVSIKITYADGTVENINGSDRMVRGETGIWYIDVYEQGN
ncbi:MAG: hypothetical protein J5537_00215 [Lachnospiraceae bacterium]|nr:hypothetical protein [Lachnospiraceae bacterium]